MAPKWDWPRLKTAINAVNLLDASEKCAATGGRWREGRPTADTTSTPTTPTRGVASHSGTWGQQPDAQHTEDKVSHN